MSTIISFTESWKRFGGREFKRDKEEPNQFLVHSVVCGHKGEIRSYARQMDAYHDVRRKPGIFLSNHMLGLG